MNKQNVNWHRLTGEETVRQLHSNASCGLSRKEARSRFRREGANALFDFPRASLAPVKRILTDPILLLTVAIGLLTICFSEPALGISALLPLLLWGILAVRAALRIKKRKDGLLCMEIPKIRVIRQSKTVWISARSVVRGDILFLQSGDVAPADCRLLTSDRLRVRFFAFQAGEKTLAPREFVKRAETVYGYGEEIYSPDFENLVYGGSEILTGSARAIVVEVGERAFLGARGSAMRARRDDRISRILESMDPYLRLFAFIVLALSIPLSIVGLLFAPDAFSAWRVFLPICTFVASTSATLPKLYFEWILHRGTEDCIKHPTYGSVPKNSRTIDLLPRIDELIVIGRSATSDGLRHFDRAFCGGVEVLPSSDGATDVLQPLCEAFLLLANAEESLPVTQNAAWEGHQPFLSELSRACSFDLNALEVRLVHSSLSVEKAERLLDVQTKEERFRLRFLRGVPASAKEGCTVLFTDQERRIPLTQPILQAVQRFAADAAHRSAAVVTVIREEGAACTLLGCLALRESFLSDIPACLDSFEQNGTRVRIFLDGESPPSLDYPLSCGCTDRLIRASNGKLISEAEPSAHFFAGYARKEILEYVRALRKSGKTVAVLGNTSADRGILSVSSLRLACEAEFSTEGTSAGFEAGAPIEKAKGFQCVPAVRRDADLLLPTASQTGGGLISVLEAERTARICLWRVRLLLGYLYSLQVFRAVLFVGVLLSGLGSVTPVIFLYSALIPDLTALFLTVKSTPTDQHRSKNERLDRAVIGRLFTQRRLWLVPTVSALLLFVLISVLRIIGLLSYETALSLVAVASVLMQAVLLIFGGERKGGFRSFACTALSLCVLLIPIAFAVLLSVLLPPVAQVLGLGAWNTTSLILLGVSPLIVLGCSLLRSCFS